MQVTQYMDDSPSIHFWRLLDLLVLLEKFDIDVSTISHQYAVDFARRRQAPR